MADMDDARLKAEIDEIVAKITSTMKKIEGLVPLDTAPSDGPGDATAGSPPAGNDAPAGPPQPKND
ncbi:MAG: hypothetical protein WAK95_00845 [Desulfobacterales bacterium]